MNPKPKTEKTVKTSISLHPEHIEFIEANVGLFGSVSGAIARGLDELIARVKEEPDAYTIRPVIPGQAVKKRI